MIDLSGKI